MCVVVGRGGGRTRVLRALVSPLDYIVEGRVGWGGGASVPILVACMFYIIVWSPRPGGWTGDINVPSFDGCLWVRIPVLVKNVFLCCIFRRRKHESVSKRNLR